MSSRPMWQMLRNRKLRGQKFRREYRGEGDQDKSIRFGH